MLSMFALPNPLVVLVKDCSTSRRGWAVKDFGDFLK
jgi:hypothetical protein